MRRLALAVLLLLVASSARAGDEHPDEVLAHVGPHAITRADVALDLRLQGGAGDADLEEALRDRAWRIAAAYLAAETGLEVSDELVRRSLQEALAAAQRAGAAIPEAGELEALERDVRRRLLAYLLGRYEQAGWHTVLDGWCPPVAETILRRAYAMSRERWPEHDVPYEVDRARLLASLHEMLERRAVAERVLEVVREPGFVEPIALARALEARAAPLLAVPPALDALLPTSRAPPLPAAVFSSFPEALAEAAASGCLLYLHVDPVPDDAEQAVTVATLERLATRYVVAVVSGRIGDRAADRLRLRFGLMRPDPFSVAVAPTGRLIDADVPLVAEAAWEAMRAAEQAADDAAPETPASLCTQAQDEPRAWTWFEPQRAVSGAPLTLTVGAGNDTAEPVGILRGTLLVQTSQGPPRRLVLRLGASPVGPGGRAETTHELRPDAPSWIHALVLVEVGSSLRRGARASVYVR